ncbi:TatD family hydrolase [Desulforhopalus sp. 52FAK]
MKKLQPDFPTLPENHYLVDSHCHLDMELFKNDLDEVLDRASLHGVQTTITIGIDVDSSHSAVEIAKTYPNIYATIGVHPHEVDKLNEDAYEVLRSLYQANSDNIVGYGEIGLDYVKMHSQPKNQRFHFNKQIDLATELQLPIIIHNREAESDTLQILRSKKDFLQGGVMHCFSGDYDFARQIIDLGMIISIPGIVTFKNATTLHEVVKKVPMENMIIETDGPFLSPHPFRGKRNEPVNVLFTAAKIAELKNIDISEVAHQSTSNARKLFNLN